MPKKQTLSKLSKKLRLEDDTYSFVKTLSAECSISASACIEAMLWMVEGVCRQDEDEGLAYVLRELKCQRLLGLESLRVMPPSSLCHVTLNPSALEFARTLHESYPPIIANATEAIDLCIRYCHQFYRDGHGLRYLCKRLDDVRKLRE